MFARFKKFFGTYWTTLLLLVTCYLLPLGVVFLGDRSYWTTLLLLVTCYLLPFGVVFLGDRPCGTTLLLLVTCYLLPLGVVFLANEQPICKARNFATRSNRRLGCPNDEYRTTIDTRFYIYRAIWRFTQRQADTDDPHSRHPNHLIFYISLNSATL